MSTRAYTGACVVVYLFVCACGRMHMHVCAFAPTEHQKALLMCVQDNQTLDEKIRWRGEVRKPAHRLRAASSPEPTIPHAERRASCVKGHKTLRHSGPKQNCIEPSLPSHGWGLLKLPVFPLPISRIHIHHELVHPLAVYLTP